MFPRIRRSISAAIAAAAAATLIGFTAAPAEAAAPANDSFSAAEVLTPGAGFQNVFGTTVDASRQAGEPSHLGGGQVAEHSIWYAYTPSQSGTVSLNVQSSETDPVVALYTGNDIAALTKLADNDDVRPGNAQALIDGYPVVAGKTYRIAIADHGDPGGFYFAIAWSSGHPQDAIVNARTIDPLGLWESWTDTATVSAGDPEIIPGATPHANVWGSFVPANNGRLDLSTEGSGFDTVMAVYSVVGGVRERIASNDDAWTGTTHSRISVDLHAKRLYLVAVGGYSSSAKGHLLLSTSWTQSIHPDNDDLSGAFALASQGTVTGSTTEATSEAGEPSHLPGNTTSKSVWYSFEGEPGRRFSADLTGTTFDSVVTLYRGTGFGNLERIATDRGSAAFPARASRLSLVPLTADQYFVAVSGVDGAAGTYEARIAIMPAPTVTKVSASGGPLSGGNQIRIDGTYLDGATKVLFGGVPAAAIDGVDGIPRAHALLVTVPAGLPGGPVDITLSTVGGTAAAHPRYVVGQPSVGSLSSRFTRLAGGRTVTVTGTEFRGTPVVRVGGVRATDVKRLSSTRLTFVTPARPVGTATVTVTTTYGSSPATSAARLTYLRVPKVTGLSRHRVTAGREIQVQGSGFVAVRGVTVAGRAATFSIVSGRLLVRIPAGATGKSGYVRVRTPGGTSAAVSGARVTYR